MAQHSTHGRHASLPVVRRVARAPRAVVTTLALALAVSLGLVGVARVASAYTGGGTGSFAGAPSWVQTDAARKGSVLFYDANGAQIGSGTDIQQVGAVGAAFGYLGVKNGDGSVTNLGPGAAATKVNASLAAPDPANASISTWANTPIPPTNYRFSPVAAGVPASVSANPAFLKLNALGQAFQDVATGVVLYTGANAEYKNVLEIRVADTVDTAHYWATDIEYNPTAAAGAYDGLAPGAWRVVWPVPSIAVATTTTTPTVSPAGASHVQGTSLTFSTTVAAASGSIAGGGTVTFFDGVTQLGAAKAVAGPVGTTPVSVSSDAVSSLAVGSHSITAHFAPTGSGFTASTSAALAQDITAPAAVATTTTTPTVSPAGASHVQGTSLTFSTTVAAASGSIAGGGSVTFFDGATQLGAAKAVAGPVGTTPVSVSSDAVSSLAVGSHSITAHFAPADAGFSASTSSPLAQTITAPVLVATTTTTPTVSPAGASHVQGTSLTFSTTVAAASGSIAGGGTVTFFDGVTQLGAAKAVAGPVGTTPLAVASDAITGLGVGSHSVTATFIPTDAGFSSSTSGTLAQSITAPVVVGTTTSTPTVAPAGSSHLVGTSLTFSTTVVAASGSIAGGGTVTFFDGATQLGAAKAVAGPVGTTQVPVSSDAVSGLGVGSHAITAHFAPADAGFLASTSGALAQGITAPVVVGTTTSTPTVAPSGASHPQGTSLTFSTTVAAASGSIAGGGTVTFFDGATQLGDAIAVAGPVGTNPVPVSSDAVSGLGVGSHAITAHFAPADAGFSASTSGALAQQITSTGGATATSLVVASGSGVFGAHVHVQALLTTSAGPVVGQFVTIALNGSESCTGVTDTAGTAVCTIKPLEAAGDYPLTASFAGTADLAASSGSATFHVALAPTVLVLRGHEVLRQGRWAAFRVELTHGHDRPVVGRTVVVTLGAGPTAATCTVTTNARGRAWCVIPAVTAAPGWTAVTAQFAGDSRYAASGASSKVRIIGRGGCHDRQDGDWQDARDFGGDS